MAKHASDTSTLELSRFVTILRRRWRWVVFALVVGIGLAAGVIIASPGSATARTEVSVNLISSNLFNSSRPASDLIDAQTEQSMARSTTVMSAVAKELGGDWTRTAVRRATTATLQPDSTVLLITFTASTPQRAAEAAALVAQEYLTYRSDLAQGRVDMASEPLVVRSESLKKRLAEANRAAAAAVSGSAAQVTAEMRAQEIRAELAGVTAQITELAGVSTSGGTVLTEADPGQVATSPNRKLILVSGALGGLMLGLALAFVVNVFDRRIHDGYDVAGAGGGDVVATLDSAQLTLPATGQEADELRALRERLLSASERPRPVFGVVEVAAQGVGVSHLGPGLALACADAGVATDLLLAEYPSAVVEGVAAALGMREVETHGRGRRFRGGVAEALTLVVPGSSRSRLSTSDLLAELLDDEVRGAEVTVVALPADAGSSTRLTLGRAADQVVLAVRKRQTSIDQLALVAEELQAVWAVVHGAVLLTGTRGVSVEREHGQTDAQTDAQPDDQTDAQPEEPLSAAAPVAVTPVAATPGGGESAATTEVPVAGEAEPPQAPTSDADQESVQAAEHETDQDAEHDAAQRSEPVPAQAPGSHDAADAVGTPASEESDESAVWPERTRTEAGEPEGTTSWAFDR